jgi:hypothetical protein
MLDQKVLDDVAKEYCANPCAYCLFKDLIARKNINIREIKQFACIQIYKYERSQDEKRDIGRQQAHEEWVERGHAKHFAEEYGEDRTLREIYNHVMNRAQID